MSIVLTPMACNYSSLISWQPSSDNLLMDSAPALWQTPVGPRIERAWPASSFYISGIISLLMLCLHSVSPRASLKHPSTTTTTTRINIHTLVRYPSSKEQVWYKKWMTEQGFVIKPKLCKDRKSVLRRSDRETHTGRRGETQRREKLRHEGGSSA